MHMHGVLQIMAPAMQAGGPMAATKAPGTWHGPLQPRLVVALVAQFC
jgi:hypothetical protein